MSFYSGASQRTRSQIPHREFEIPPADSFKRVKLRSGRSSFSTDSSRIVGKPEVTRCAFAQAVRPQLGTSHHEPVGQGLASYEHWVGRYAPSTSSLLGGWTRRLLLNWTSAGSKFVPCSARLDGSKTEPSLFSMELSDIGLWPDVKAMVQFDYFKDEKAEKAAQAALQRIVVRPREKDAA